MDLFPASELVFRSIRTGFPTAPIVVTGNALDIEEEEPIRQRAKEVGGGFANIYRVTHSEWIAGLINRTPEPFFICDTDVIFWKDMEGFEFKGPMHGRHVPAFACPVTETDTMERLHTALLYIDPREFRQFNQLHREQEEAAHPFPIQLDLVKPVRFALSNRIMFNDTLGQAFHTLGGFAFSPEMLDCYDHISCGTYLDLLDKKIPGSLDRQMDYVLHPEKAKGLWRQQQKYLEGRPV